MPLCRLCDLDLIDTDRKHEFTCCDAACHTACFLEANRLWIATGRYQWMPFVCPGCESDLIAPLHGPEAHSGHEAASIDADPFQPTPEDKIKLRKIREANTQERKAAMALGRKVKEAHLGFRQAIVEHVGAIQTAKRTAVLGLKTTPEWLEATRASNRARSLRTRFLNTHPLLRWWDKSRLGLRRIRTAYSGSLNWTFRIRL